MKSGTWIKLRIDCFCENRIHLTKTYDFLLRFMIIISKNPTSQDKICLNDEFWSGTVLDFPDENKNLYDVTAYIYRRVSGNIILLLIDFGVRFNKVAYKRCILLYL